MYQFDIKSTYVHVYCLKHVEKQLRRFNDTAVPMGYHFFTNYYFLLLLNLKQGNI